MIIIFDILFYAWRSSSGSACNITRRVAGVRHIDDYDDERDDDGRDDDILLTCVYDHMIYNNSAMPTTTPNASLSLFRDYDDGTKISNAVRRYSSRTLIVYYYYYYYYCYYYTVIIASSSYILLCRTICVYII